MKSKKVLTFTSEARKGLTLIELLLVIAIVAILAAASSPFVSRFVLQINLDTTVDKIVGSMRKAQTYAMSGKEGVPWGVCISNGDVRMYGDSCATPLIKEDIDVPQSISVSGISDTAFNRRGEPDDPITVTVSSTIESRAIIINRAGGIEIQ